MEDLLTDISKGNRKHMTLSDRIIIELIHLQRDTAVSSLVR